MKLVTQNVLLALTLILVILVMILLTDQEILVNVKLELMIMEQPTVNNVYTLVKLVVTPPPVFNVLIT